MPSSKIGKAMGFPSLEESDPEMLGDDEAPVPGKDDGGVNAAEVLAMKQFERASGPEAKAQAMRDFLEACGVY